MVSRRRFFDALFVSALVLYALAGMTLSPFHGDETTTIYLSRDWATIVLQGNPSAVRYQPNYSDDQQLRLVNGVISKYVIGLAWSTLGLKVSDLPSAWWWWGADLKSNQDQGHIPNSVLLLASRLTSTLMTMLSISLVFAVARRITSPTMIGLPHVVTFVYATLPAVLLNGRRAMYEGATLLAVALIMLAALVLARRLRGNSTNKSVLVGWLFLGLACGFAIATKHTSLLTIFAALATLVLVDSRPLNLLGGIGAFIVAGLIFLALNPAWWGAPLQVLNEVIKERQDIIKVQIEQYGAYTNVPARVVGLVTLPLSAPQYYEDTQNYPGSRGWSDWIGSQITTYEHSRTAGIFWGPFSGVLWLFAAIGFAGLRHVPPAERWVLLGIIVLTAIGTLVLNPLPWQRYYLPMAPVLAILIGLGLRECVILVSRLRREAPSSVPNKSAI